MVALTSNLDLLGLFALEKYVSLVIYMVPYSKHDDKRAFSSVVIPLLKKLHLFIKV